MGIAYETSLPLFAPKIHDRLQLALKQKFIMKALKVALVAKIDGVEEVFERTSIEEMGLSELAAFERANQD